MSIPSKKRPEAGVLEDLNGDGTKDDE